ncbi:serine hydrolase [Brevundimonas vesicularis]|uniref:serine hydrolase n=1 Tax=Brevundimonas vesicularis TaxID=41276 RepID=UPI0038D3F162
MVAALVTALGLMAGTATAQDPARMAEIAAAYTRSGEFSGAVLVAKDDRVLLDQGFGLANREWNIPNDGDTKFRLGSVSKQFTAAAILLLNERNLVELDAPIKTWVDAAPAAWDQVTVRHLLNHTSGIPNLTALPDFAATKTLPATLPDLIGRFRDLPLEFAPGERFAYSNSGYILLSAIIEKVSGQTYEQFVRDSLFTPLGMVDSGYDHHAVILPKRADGYTLTPRGVTNADYVDMTVPMGAGALYSTSRDLLKWHQGLYGGKLLTPPSLVTMTTPVRNGFGMGVVVVEEDGRRLIWHNGGIEGFNAYLAYDPDERTSIVVLGNQNGTAPDAIGRHLVTLVQGGEVVLPHERKSITVATEILQSYVGVYQVIPTFALTVTVVEGQLMAQATGQNAFVLHAEAEDRFFLTEVDARITFERDTEGRITGLILHQNGQTIPAKRI